MKKIIKQPIYYGIIALYIVGYYAYGIKGLFWILAITIVPTLLLISTVNLVAKNKLEKLADLVENNPEKFKKLLSEV